MHPQCGSPQECRLRYTHKRVIRRFLRHEVYKIHAVHQVNLDVRTEERLLPLFWAINSFKQRQEDFATITELGGATIADSTEKAVAEIFELVPLRTYRWDAKAQKAELTYGKREDADEACRKTFALTSARPEAIPLFVQTAHSWLCRKASNDHHEYKFLAAILEDATLVSPEWQPHLMSAAVHYFHGNQTPDNPVMQQTREALKKVG